MRVEARDTKNGEAAVLPLRRDVAAVVAPMLADAKFYEALVGRIPLGRIAEPEDVVGAVLFFASRAADFITGQTMYLDGGITATQ